MALGFGGQQVTQAVTVPLADEDNSARTDSAVNDILLPGKRDRGGGGPLLLVEQRQGNLG